MAEVATTAWALAPGECSCGVPGCPEMGWPHEWYPGDDDCIVCCGREGPLRHEDTVRYGSGYAHSDCADPPPPIDPAPVEEARAVHGFDGDDS